jgi:pimeloyl-ACP methyl ester carboxylesterase
VFDNGAGFPLEDFMALMAAAPRPQAPPQPARADLASPAALAAWTLRVNRLPYPEGEAHESMTRQTPGRITKAIWDGAKKFAQIKVPVLAICAQPHDNSANLRKFTDADQRAKYGAFMAQMETRNEKQIEVFRKGVPGAHVEVLPNANHNVFGSNEADVLREIKAFLGMLP